MKITHCCDVREEAGYGSAIAMCWTEAEGRMLVASRGSEYLGQVNFCPFCGARAPVKVDPKAEFDRLTVASLEALDPDEIEAVLSGCEFDEDGVAF